MNIRPFEIALIGIFAIAAIFGLFFFSNFDSQESQNKKIYGDSISIWGTLDKQVVEGLLYDLTKTNKALSVVKYKQIDARSFESVLLNAIADGQSPDLVVMPHTLLASYRSKLQPISFETVPERTFRDTYIDGADIFMLSDGIYGIPFAVDPLVMYWNKDIFSSSGLAQPPKTWESLLSESMGAIVRTSDNLEITQSTLAFGEYTNVAHVKKILAMLFLQAGSSIVEEQDGGYIVTLNRSSENALPPGEAALTFYTQFVVPSREYYTWNRSKELDRKEFLNGTLALYFAPGSERKNLERDNPNLNFDTTFVPQGSEVTTNRDYGDFYAFSIPRASKNIQGAYAVATQLTSKEAGSVLSEGYGFAPVHRASFGSEINETHKNVVYKSALISHGWLDPSPELSGMVFQKMIEDVTSGKVRLKNILRDTVSELKSLYK
ncbi:MAG: extracellular solute-binding protein [Minisyncoccia bacterium]